MEERHHDPVEQILGMVGGRWRLLIIRRLTGGSMRFGELRRSLPGVTQKVLTDALRSMEDAGLIRRTVYPEVPLRVTYSLTGAGYRLTPILTAMSNCCNDVEQSRQRAQTSAGNYYTPTHGSSGIDFQQQMQEVRQALDESEAVIIGLGSGLSRAYGIDCFDAAMTRRLFPAFFEMGFTTVDEMIDVYSHCTEGNQREFAAFWTSFLRWIAALPPTDGHKKLRRLVGDKPYFVITTNCDTLEEKAGFSPDRIYRPLGNYTKLQCAIPCCDTLYGAEEMDLDGPPLCPHCGGPLVPNHYRNRVISVAVDKEIREAYTGFCNEVNGCKTVYLEVGCSLRIPTLIRYPFERMSAENPKGYLIRCNSTSLAPVVPVEKGIFIGEDIRRVLEKL